MKRALAALALLLAGPAVAQGGAGDRQAAATAAADAAARERVTRAITGGGFAGVYAVYAGPRRIAGGSVGEAAPGQGGFDYQVAWPWASVTKQVIATLIMQEVEDGRIALDAPASRYLPRLTGGATVRQLLQHRAGLPNPETTAKDAGGVPAFYTAARYNGAAGLDWCLTARSAPGGAWAYNNCDYLVLGALLQQVTRTPLPALFARRIAAPLGLTAGFIAPVASTPDARWPGGPTDSERAQIARYGAAGALVGTPVDLITFDRALLSGALLTSEARAEMWRGDPALGFMGLGQWSFTAPLAGCAKPVRIVERRGAIGRFAVRNAILPDLGISVALFTNRGDPDTGGFGEVWQGKGITHDVLAAAACP